MPYHASIPLYFRYACEISLIDSNVTKTNTVLTARSYTVMTATITTLLVPRGGTEARRSARSALAHVAAEDFNLFSSAHQRASRNGPSHTTWRAASVVGCQCRGLSGDFMYITIPQAGTRAVHCWLTGRRSRRSRIVVRATRLAERNRENVR